VEIKQPEIAELAEVPTIEAANQKLREGWIFVGVASRGADGNVYVFARPASLMGTSGSSSPFARRVLG
jgi:hypothetical protein